MNTRSELIKSSYTGFVDHEGASLEVFRPKLLVNDYEEGQKVLTSIIKELSKCDEFFFSVAFITQSGVQVLINTLQELEARQIKGKIVASQYLNFTEPKALERLLKFKNIELRMVVNGNHHAKGYIFKDRDTFSLIIGSSNLTQDALCSNKELNIKISSMERGSLVRDTLLEFEKTYKQAEPVDSHWIETYKEIYCEKHRVEDQVTTFISVEKPKGYNIDVPQLKKIMPNKMQIDALAGIDNVRQRGENKAILISATGTGKTYLAAFDVRKIQPRRFLFLVHREQILNQAIASFKNVLGNGIQVGKLSSHEKKIDVQYLFSTVQMMSKPHVLTEFAKDTFSYIVIDESHRMGGETYQRVMEYFTPEFLLGMTATPDRMDKHNIFGDFDYNIAYEIRLQEAMKEDMLCPFHYYGITDLSVNGNKLDDLADFQLLVSPEQLEHILEKIQLYGYHGDRVKGLVFCNHIENARKLSSLFNHNGYKTVALTGEDSQEAREIAISRLEQEPLDNRLDYIFTVDIFNEGVDIPKVNQVILLRPTQSSIIFLQQLGRGLRKAIGKDYVVILDFIGNHKNNFLIPIALSDDKTYNKDTIRRFVSEGSRVIPGCSTINFDAISEKHIFDSIDQVDNKRYTGIIDDAYKLLKYRLGRIPRLMDFEEHDTIDIELIFKHPSYGSYYQFLLKKDESFTIRLNEAESKWIKLISNFAIGKRPHEMLVIKQLLLGSQNVLIEMRDLLILEFGIDVFDKTYKNVVNVLINEFPTGTAKNTFKDCIFLEKAGQDYGPSREFLRLIANLDVKAMVEELIELGLYRYSKYYGKCYKNSSLQLYQKYSYEDVCRLLEWEKNEVSLNIGGYKYNEKSGTFPVFINYKKEDNVALTIKYEDRFQSPTEIIALSKSNRTTDSNDVQIILKAQELGVNIELFVRKNKDDHTSKEFYYLGRLKAEKEPRQIKMPGTGVNAVEIKYQLETAVRDDIYEYLVED